jgi:hypothetical protein
MNAVPFADEPSRAVIQARTRCGVPNLTFTLDGCLAVLVVSTKDWGHQDRIFRLSEPMSLEQRIAMADGLDRTTLLNAMQLALKQQKNKERREALQKFIDRYGAEA